MLTVTVDDCWLALKLRVGGRMTIGARDDVRFTCVSCVLSPLAPRLLAAARPHILVYLRYRLAPDAFGKMRVHARYCSARGASILRLHVPSSS